MIEGESDTIELLVGKNMTVDMALKLDGETMVGKFVGRKISYLDLGECINEN